MVTKRRKTAAPISPLGERLIQAADACGHLTLEAIEKALEMNKGSMSSYKTGRRGGTTIDPERLSKIARYLCVDFEWLATGAGSMYRDLSPFETAVLIAKRKGIKHFSIFRSRAANASREAELRTDDWLDLFEEAEAGADLM